MTEAKMAPVGYVESPLTALTESPRQGDEGAPEAWLAFDARVAAALDGVAAGDEMLLVTWLHLARRDVLQVHPRDDPRRPLTGVFATRSPDRPNPLGLHRVRVLEVAGTRVRVAPLEAVDGTPILDLKPILAADGR